MSYPEPNTPHARADAFSRPDTRGLGTEREVSRFIGDLVRMLAPEIVVETGTGNGDTTAHIVAALAENQARGLPGRAWSFDTSAARYNGARERFRGLGMLTLECRSVTEWTPPAPIGLAFVDSAISARRPDLEHLERYMAPHAIALVHDVEMRQSRELLAWLEGAGYRVVRLATPRGLAIVQRLAIA